MATAREKQFNNMLANLARTDIRQELDDMLASPPPPPDFLDRNFPEQCAFIEDPSRLKVVLCTRRAGKSYGDGLYLFKEAYENPGCSVAYFGLTRQSAKNVMWKDVLSVINRKFRIGAVPNLSELSWTLPNGSVIYLFGVDSSADEMRKVFGQKFNLAIIDEGALYTIDLRSLVYSVLQPAMIDCDGTICITGMPSDLLRGLFFQLTQDAVKDHAGADDGASDDFTRDETDEDEDDELQFDFEWSEDRRRWTVHDRAEGSVWSGHFWTAYDNPHTRDAWAKAIDSKKANNPRIEETPIFQKEWLGKWVVDGSKYVYKYDPFRNTFDVLPDHDGKWNYVLGVDLGHEDDSAFVVLAYHPHDTTAYILESWSKKKMDITDVAERIKLMSMRYDFEAIVVDGSNKMAVEEMKKRHDLWGIQAVQKKYKVGNSRRAKANVIEVMNGDFVLGRIKVHSTRCKSLVTEYQNLIWDDRANGLGPRQEHPRCANHNCFVAGTLVRTEHGERPIESLRAGDLVWTREGLRPVVVGWQSGIEPIWTLETTAGTLRGTHDHPVWTQDGWKPLSSLTPRDTVTLWENTDRPKRSHTKASTTEGTRNQTNTPCAPTTQRSGAEGCTACSTKKRTAHNCREQSTSTTSTGTHSTTTSRISRLLTDASTFASTCWNRLKGSLSRERVSKPQSSTHQRGTGRKKVAHGTGSTGAGQWLRVPKSDACAKCVAPCFSRKTRTPEFADATATLGNAEQVVSTTSTSSAPSAARRSSETSTQNPAVVLGRVLAVSPPESGSASEPVYALSVEGVHEFFANDVLVSNCDAAFYSWLSVHSYLSTAVENAPQPGTSAWFEQEALRLEQRDSDRMQQQVMEAEQSFFEDIERGHSTVIDLANYWGRG